MRIIVVNKEVFQNRPPVISSLLSLSDLGYNVSLICVGINDYWTAELDKRGIDCLIIPDKKSRGILCKIIEYRRFKKETLDYLAKNVCHDSFILWVIGGNTIYCIGKDLKKYRYILQIQELHEKEKHYRRVFSQIINDAEAVFVNEFNRAVLYQCWYNMKSRPHVIPNKPYFIDTQSSFDLSPYVDSSVLEILKNTKVILFQGQIVSYRDLSPYIKAAKELGGFQIVLLGNEYDGMVDRYRMIDDSLVYIKRIPAPQYLGITALSHICLITYDPHSLNNSYCAPNKVYEYGAFGKPMLGNDIPGLRVIEDYNAGILVDEGSINSIKEAILSIEANYTVFSQGAQRLYNSVDNKSTIGGVIRKLSNTETV